MLYVSLMVIWLEGIQMLMLISHKQQRYGAILCNLFYSNVSPKLKNKNTFCNFYNEVYVAISWTYNTDYMSWYIGECNHHGTISYENLAALPTVEFWPPLFCPLVCSQVRHSSSQNYRQHHVGHLLASVHVCCDRSSTVQGNALCKKEWPPLWVSVQYCVCFCGIMRSPCAK